MDQRPSTKKPLGRRGEPVVRAILEATVEELARVGFARLRVEAVAARTGVNKTTVYRRFGTKDQLVHQALSRVIGDVYRVEETGAVRTDLIACLGRAATLLQSARGQAVFRVLFAEGADPAVVRLAEKLLLDEGTVVPLGAIERGISRGELPPEINPRLVLFTLIGATVHRIFVEHASLTMSHVEQLVDLVLFGAVGVSTPGGQR